MAKAKKKTLWAKLKTTGKELVMGDKTYMPKSKSAEKNKAQLGKWRYETRKKQQEVYGNTTRTTYTSEQLKKAGISDAQIRRLRGG